MKMNIFIFLSKIAAACKIWSQKPQSCLIIKMFFLFWFIKYFDLSNVSENAREILRVYKTEVRCIKLYNSIFQQKIIIYWQNFNFNLYFFSNLLLIQNISHFNIGLGRGFPAVPNVLIYLFIFWIFKQLEVRKIVQWIKNRASMDTTRYFYPAIIEN